MKLSIVPVILVAGVALLAGCASQSTSSRPSEFRAYRANDQLQLDRIPTLNEDEPGCHNFLLGLRVYRVAQIGFKQCSIYEEGDCKPGTEVPVSWKQEDDPVKQFTQGDRWFLVADHAQGRGMASWSCQARE